MAPRLMIFPPWQLWRNIVVATAVAFGLGIQTLPLAAQTPQAAPREGMLAMRNGGVLSGKVTRAGDHYLLALPGGQMRIHEVDVEFFCADLDDAYRLKRDSLAEGQPEEHLNLASWCLKHQLHGYAARELIEARLLDASHPRIELMERQLSVVLARAAHRPGEANQPLEPAEPVRLETSSEIQQLPRGALESFANQVHPILMNRCSRGGCHGPGTTSAFQLDRGAVGRSFTNRMTQRNLQAALQFIDRENPAASLLLRKPTVAHGPLAQPVFSAADIDEYTALVSWTDRLNKTPPQQLSRIVAAPAEALLQKMNSISSFESPTVVDANMVRQATYEDAAQAGPSEKTSPDKSPPGQTATVEFPARPRHIQRGAPVVEAPAANPYDPAGFNSGG